MTIMLKHQAADEHRAGDRPEPESGSEDFDEYLGPADQRYFGSGYRRVKHQILELAIRCDPDGSAALAGMGAALYPHDWSNDAAGVPRKPHLSTIDALVMSVSMAEEHLRRVDGLSEAQLGAAWLVEIDVKAGAQPWDQLDNIPLFCRRTSLDRSGTSAESAFKAKVGAMSVVVRLRHDFPVLDDAAARQGERGKGVRNASCPGRALEGRYRETGHKSSVRLIEVDGEVVMDSTHRIAPRGQSRPEGLESSYWPSVTVIDCLVIASQMAQVLIFAAPSVSRSTASNLWMRRARFTAKRPPQAGTYAAAVLRITGERSFDRGKEGSLHSVDVECSNLFGIAASASLAYTLPVADGELPAPCDRD